MDEKWGSNENADVCIVRIRHELNEMKTVVVYTKVGESSSKQLMRILIELLF